MNFAKVKPLSKAAIQRALKLAKTLNTYETNNKPVPQKLVIQFCETLDIAPEAAPFDPAVQWPRPCRMSVPSRGWSRLSQFESAYFGPEIEATRYTDYEPQWLRRVSEQVMDRCVDEKTNPFLRYSVTGTGQLLDSVLMVNEQHPLVFDKPSRKWIPFDGSLREWQNAKWITAEEAARLTGDVAGPKA